MAAQYAVYYIKFTLKHSAHYGILGYQFAKDCRLILAKGFSVGISMLLQLTNAAIDGAVHSEAKLSPCGHQWQERKTTFGLRCVFKSVIGDLCIRISRSSLQSRDVFWRIILFHHTIKYYFACVIRPYFHILSTEIYSVRGLHILSCIICPDVSAPGTSF